jgi:hypothetical protein
MRKTARAKASRSGFHHVMMMIHSVRERSKSVECVLEFAQAIHILLQKYDVQVTHECSTFCALIILIEIMVAYPKQTNKADRIRITYAFDFASLHRRPVLQWKAV